MRKIRISTPQGRSLVITGGHLNDLPGLLPSCSLFIITDTNVRALYGDRFPKAEILTIEPGEGTKTLGVVGELCSKLLDAGANRHSFILGIGGGVVCDIAGLVASLFMRGVRHGFVSTTLLSQVDASIGGKTGVNIGRWKNMIGTFKQPEFVLCDHKMLDTLPDREFHSGVGELIKHAVIMDRDLFFDISSSLEKLFARDTQLIEDLILRAVTVKAGIIRRDPYEKDIRRILNFGHTFGHVLETTYSLPHGVAVMEGMLIAASLSVWAGEMHNSEFHLLEKVIENTGLTVKHELPENVLALVARDKKGESGSMNFVLLRAIGKAVVRKLPVTEAEAFIKYFRESRKISFN